MDSFTAQIDAIANATDESVEVFASQNTTIDTNSVVVIPLMEKRVSVITEEDRKLLEKLSETVRPTNYLMESQSLEDNNRDGTPGSLNLHIGLPPPQHKVEKCLSSSDMIQAPLHPISLTRIHSSDTIMRKSALSQRDRSKPRKPKCVTFSESTSNLFYECGDETRERDASEVEKLQKELEELRKKLNEFQTQTQSIPKSNTDVVVELPQLSDDTAITDIIGMIATKYNLSTDIIKQDFEIMNKARIKDVRHLKLLMNNEQLWKEFELPILEKCAIEQLLGKPETPSSWLWVGVAAFVPVALTGILFNNPTTTKLLRFFEDLFEI